MNTSDTRQHVHSLVDQLPAAQLSALAGLLESMVDPLSAALANAPLDDEEITDEEAESIRQSREWFKDNPGTSFEDLMAELGFSLEDIRNCKKSA